MVAAFGIPVCDPSYKRCNYNENILYNRILACLMLMIMVITLIIAIISVVIHCRSYHGILKPKQNRAQETEDPLQEQNRLLREQISLQQQQLQIMQQQQEVASSSLSPNQLPPPSYESCVQDSAQVNMLLTLMAGTCTKNLKWKIKTEF